MAKIPILVTKTIDIVTQCTICGKDLMSAIMTDPQTGKISISIDPIHDCKLRTSKDKQPVITNK